MDSKLGEYVGYYYKGANVTSDKTMLLFTTTGSLLSRMTGKDPYLTDYKIIIVDEAHERSVQTDQVLLLLKNALAHRADLRLIIMSATIDTTVFKNFYNTSTFNEINIPGISYPITHYWTSKLIKNWHEETVNIILRILNSTTDGDILVFGKSSGDGTQICSMLETEILKLIKQNKHITQYPYCTKFSSGSSTEEEHYAKEQYAYMELESKHMNGYNRKVVVSTNVAESSITISGIKYVIDSGLELTDSFDPNTMVRCLLEEPASQASITQRAGRGGRLGPGICFHLYSEQNFKARPKFSTPNIQKTDITPDILDLLKLDYIKSEADLKQLLGQFISPPENKFIDMSLRVLSALKAVDDTGKITAHGQNISMFRGISPGLASALIHSWHLFTAKSMGKIVAGLTVLDGQMGNIFIDPKKGDTNQFIAKKKAVRHFTHNLGDIFTLLNIVNEYMAMKLKLGVKDYINPNEELAMLPEIGVISLNEPVTPVEQTQTGGDIYQVIPGDLTGGDIHQVISGDLTGGADSARDLNGWCKANFISHSKLKKIVLMARELGRILSSIDKKTLPYPAEFYKKLNSEQETERIIYALLIGNPQNIAIKAGMVYEPLFPKSPINCRKAMDTTLYTNPQYLYYAELFSNVHGLKNVKMNIVNQIPDAIINAMKEHLPIITVRPAKSIAKPPVILAKIKTHKLSKAGKAKPAKPLTILKSAVKAKSAVKPKQVQKKKKKYGTKKKAKA